MKTVMNKDVQVHNDDYKVILTYIGEGCCGDYDPSDPNDYPHIRADIYDMGDDLEPLASTCTGMDATISDEKAKEYALSILNRFVKANRMDAESALAKAI